MGLLKWYRGHFWRRSVDRNGSSDKAVLALLPYLNLSSSNDFLLAKSREMPIMKLVALPKS